MKKNFIISLCLLTSSLLAQNNGSSNNITNYPALSLYSQLENPLPKKYIYADNFNQFIDVPEEPDLRVYSEAEMLNSMDMTSQWMGNSQTKTFRFMGHKATSTQIFDLNGVLRESSMSIQLNKKKK